MEIISDCNEVPGLLEFVDIVLHQVVKVAYGEGLTSEFYLKTKVCYGQNESTI